TPLARVHHLRAVVVADQEGTDAALPGARSGKPAADDELLAEVVLDLQPGVRALARLVAAVEALGHDALEAELLAGGQRRLALSPGRGGRLPVAALELEGFEPAAPPRGSGGHRWGALLVG